MSGRTRRQWSLRRRLVVSIVALLAVVGIIVGTVSVLALRQNLVARLDSQLAGVIAAASAPEAVRTVGAADADAALALRNRHAADTTPAERAIRGRIMNKVTSLVVR